MYANVCFDTLMYVYVCLSQVFFEYRLWILLYVLCVYTSMCLYVSIHTYIHTFIQTYVHTTYIQHIYIQIHLRIYTNLYPHMYIHAQFIHTCSHHTMMTKSSTRPMKTMTKRRYCYIHKHALVYIYIYCTYIYIYMLYIDARVRHTRHA
jgi:hypothetical protein